MRVHNIMFDTHKYIKQLQSKGFKEAQAASIVELVSESRAHDLSNLATKEDIANVRGEISNVRGEIKDVKFDILKWIIPLILGLMLEIWFKK